MTLPAKTIVVSGPPRSGTSLLMQMLVSAGIEAITDGERAGDADNPRGYFEHERIKRLSRDQAVLQNSGGKAVKVIHSLLKYIPQDMPLAVLFLERDLHEVIASQFAMLDRLGRPRAKLDPERMLELLRAQLAAVRKELEHRTDTIVLDLCFRDLLSEPTVTTQRIVRFLEPVLVRPLDVRAMADCVDESLYHQRLLGK